MNKTNIHTHTEFCDGKSTAEEMVLEAIKRGFTAIGFSTHSIVEYASVYGLRDSDAPKYKAEISRLKNLYGDKIKIFCGLELDSHSSVDTSGYEYIIASVHGVEKNGKVYEVDHSEEQLRLNIAEGWNGDVYAFAKDYFEAVSKQEGDVIGHIDLLCKFNEGDRMFSTKDERYLACAEAAVKELCRREQVMEINTGAIGRGYRETPYPSEEIMQMIKKHGGRLIVTSDCHNKDYIDCGFDKAYELLHKYGFEETTGLLGNTITVYR